MGASAARRVAVGIVAGDLALVGVYALYTQTGSFHWLVHGLFDLDAEATIPAWYASAQLLLAGSLFLLASIEVAPRAPRAPRSARGAPVVGRRGIARGLFRERPHGDRPVPGWFLALGGGGLAFLAADEAVGIHESITIVAREANLFRGFGGGRGAWIPLYLAIGATLTLLTLPSSLALWRTERRGASLLLVGALVFLAGAVGVEFATYGDLRAAGPASRLYLLSVAVEEGLELLGVSLILFGSARATSTLVPGRGVLRAPDSPCESGEAAGRSPPGG